MHFNEEDILTISVFVYELTDIYPFLSFRIQVSWQMFELCSLFCVSFNFLCVVFSCADIFIVNISQEKNQFVKPR